MPLNWWILMKTVRIFRQQLNLLELYTNLGQRYGYLMLMDQLTDFDKLFKNEVAQLKANSSSVPQNHPLMREFREAVWFRRTFNSKSAKEQRLTGKQHTLPCCSLPCEIAAR
ncbi:uncharacterized protein LOC103933333 [Pyrus x bretschneideri]|uniref:uncharacterized protein LOC103933333 n=1 Tax=Pyrus x bretschneideri TaxID=225117 RepID=UPI00202F3471|nr:uncharacterized protein LOC103933333 [Pyrus x bretschneideri]XP_048442687.1 uncharacterized protein LOC103933333 [Pyrus x bretschneideri]